MNSAAELHAVGLPERPPGGPVLVVDLDGTVVKTDLLLESIVALVKQSPWQIFSLPIWLLKGVAFLKQQVGRRVSLDVNTLPYREEVLEYLKSRRVQGCAVILATGADIQIARKIADHLGVFDAVIASDGTNNLFGRTKRDLLVHEFGERGFDYIGNSARDLPVWAAARNGIVVNPTAHMLRGVAKVTRLDRVFEDRKKLFLNCLKALRPLHWLKNLLVFVPLLAAHRLDDMKLVWTLTVAFLAFGCLASSGYLINDLLDLEADRRHPTKRFRPFASGDLSLGYAFVMIPILAILGCCLGKLVSDLFLAAVLTYFALSLTYSLYVKKIAILDVLFLAGLYTMRILAGSAAVLIWPSHWLLAFSTFVFLSLALVKRYGELALMKRVDGDGAKARAYEISDGELLAAMGIASGYLAVLVLAFYINSDKAQALYGHYQLMWLLCPLLLYWISDIWLIAHRGRMPDDPIVFAINDRTSRILIALMLAISVLAL